MAGTWTTVAKARTDFADMLDDLSAEQLEAQSLCSEWRVIDVAGHLVSLVELSILQLGLGVLKNRGNGDRYLASAAKDFSSRSAQTLASTLRDKADKQLKPFSEASMVADTAVHTLDVQRPLGLDAVLDPQVLTVALDEGAKVLAKKFKGDSTLRLVATDMDWSSGSGPEVRGTGEALLLAMNNRDVDGELDGAGVDLLPA